MRNPFIKSCHLCDATRVVRDWAKNIDGRCHGQGTKHTQGIQCNAEHATQRVRDQDRDAAIKDRNDGGEVAQSQGLDESSDILVWTRSCPHWVARISTVEMIEQEWRVD